MPSPLPDPIVLAPAMPPLADLTLPLQGLTVLAVEDSRFACDALRLLCQRLGARLRRAETLEQARAHLRVYRPDVVLVDLGLPDGRGEGLIRLLATGGPGRPGLLGISGDPAGRGAALAAGADGFLEKPVAGLATFQRALLDTLPDRNMGDSGAGGGDGVVTADQAALHDDLLQAALAVDAGPGDEERHYLAGFLSGLALQAEDTALSTATSVLRCPGAELKGLARLLDDRLTQSTPFRPDGRGNR